MPVRLESLSFVSLKISPCRTINKSIGESCSRTYHLQALQRTWKAHHAAGSVPGQSWMHWQHVLLPPDWVPHQGSFQHTTAQNRWYRIFCCLADVPCGICHYVLQRLSTVWSHLPRGSVSSAAQPEGPAEFRPEVPVLQPLAIAQSVRPCSFCWEKKRSNTHLFCNALGKPGHLQAFLALIVTQAHLQNFVIQRICAVQAVSVSTVHMWVEDWV